MGALIVLMLLFLGGLELFNRRKGYLTDWEKEGDFGVKLVKAPKLVKSPTPGEKALLRERTNLRRTLSEVHGVGDPKLAHDGKAWLRSTKDYEAEQKKKEELRKKEEAWSQL